MNRPSMVLQRRARAPFALPLVFALCVLGAGCGSTALPSSPLPASPVVAVPTPAPSPKVVVLSVDGLRGDAIATADLPNLKGLALRGAYTWTARTVWPSQTLSGHASMLSGQDPKVHNVTWDEYVPEKGTITVPTVLSVARAAGLRTVMVVGKRKLQHLAAPGSIDSFVLTERGDVDVANEAVTQVSAGFDLLFVHFPDVDITGHAEGWMSAAYLAKLGELDVAAGRVLAALPPETTVIVTADHGGKGQTHGRDITEDMTIPWIVAGPKVTRRGVLTGRVTQMDTAATALYVLGLSLPSGCAGQVVREAFASP